METVRNIPYSVLMTVYKNDSLDDFVMALESIISQKYGKAISHCPSTRC